MIRSRGVGGPSKATPQTLCQKCLKRDNYQCQATAQERPYASRPSRTQQLANPKLVPKLASDVPNELLRKKGVADEVLAKNEEARGRKRSRSTSSTDSVSTISTNRSRSASYPIEMKIDSHDDFYTSQQEPQIRERSRKRQRSLSSVSSASDSSRSSSSHDRRGSSLRTEENRNTRRRRSSISPRARGRDRDLHDHSTERRRRKSRSNSMNRSQIARNRNSLTPVPREKLDVMNNSRGERRGLTGDTRRQSNLRESQEYDGNTRRYNDERRNDRGRSDARDSTNGSETQAPPLPRKQRSLSPFSKRRALTRAMQAGR